LISSPTLASTDSKAAPTAPLIDRLASDTVPMARVSLVRQAAVLALSVPLYHYLGLSFAWSTLMPHFALVAVLFGFWGAPQTGP
jgi:hypothetical protein